MLCCSVLRSARVTLCSTPVTLCFDACDGRPLLQDIDKEPRHDAGLPISHPVTGIHGQCLHCGGIVLLDLCHHGGAALWWPLLDLQ